MDKLEWLIVVTIIFVLFMMCFDSLKKEKIEPESTYEQGYETGALCGSKFGYDDCMYILKETK